MTTHSPEKRILKQVSKDYIARVEVKPIEGRPLKMRKNDKIELTPLITNLQPFISISTPIKIKKNQVYPNSPTKERIQGTLDSPYMVQRKPNAFGHNQAILRSKEFSGFS